MFWLVEDLASVLMAADQSGKWLLKTGVTVATSLAIAGEFFHHVEARCK